MTPLPKVPGPSVTPLPKAPPQSAPAAGSRRCPGPRADLVGRNPLIKRAAQRSSSDRAAGMITPLPRCPANVTPLPKAPLDLRRQQDHAAAQGPRRSGWPNPLIKTPLPKVPAPTCAAGMITPLPRCPAQASRHTQSSAPICAGIRITPLPKVPAPIWLAEIR